MRGKMTLETVVSTIVVVVTFAFFSTLLLSRPRPIGCKRPGDLVIAGALQSAVENFYGEYNRLPDIGASWVTTDSREGVALLKILLAMEESEVGAQNERNIVFLQAKEARNRRGGLDYAQDGKVEGLFDAFGHPYRVVLNADYGDELSFQFAGETQKLRGKQVAVWSPGEDGMEGTKDDMKTWH